MELDRDALDRYITGNYGEDQFRGEIELNENDAYSVDGHAGIAFRFVGWEQVWRPAQYLAIGEDGEECWVDDNNEGDREDDPDGMARMVMVGDDHEWLVDVSDIHKIGEDDYCGGCGQIGCGWG